MGRGTRAVVTELKRVLKSSGEQVLVMPMPASHARLTEDGSGHLHFNRIPGESGARNSLELMDWSLLFSY